MPYEKKISRAEPGLIAFALDDSGSMTDCLPGTRDEKFKWVERYGGVILRELLMRSTEVKGDSAVVKPRYHMHVVLYGSGAQVWGDGEMDIETAVQKYTASGNSLGLRGALGGTDAQAAFKVVLDHLKQAVVSERFRNSFPPMAFHLTDGQSHTDASATAEEIKKLFTTDGRVLVVNAYIGTQTSLSYQSPSDFPGYLDPAEAGPDEDNLRLFYMSSEVPECIRANLVEDEIFPKLREGARLFFDVRTRDMLKHVLQVVGSLGSRADRLLR